MTSNTFEHPAFARARELPDSVRAYFPLSVDEAQDWTPKLLRRALSTKVLAVAVPRVECAWSAYIDAVPGLDHRREMDAVKATGAKLDEDLARRLFPIFDDVPYAK